MEYTVISLQKNNQQKVNCLVAVTDELQMGFYFLSIYFKTLFLG